MAEPARQISQASSPTLIGIMGVMLEALPEGALWWADEKLLIVADLHFEKGSAFARRGQLLPPYDTAETLARLSDLVERFDPATVIALGDSFHDEDGAGRMAPSDQTTLARLQHRRTWIWIAGNHDPAAPAGLSGDCLESIAIGRLILRHEPSGSPADGEIAGHLHPAARIAGRGRTVRRRCFVGDGRRLVIPAFGAYAGGLNILDRAFSGLFTEPLKAFVLGKERVYCVIPAGLRPD